MKNEITNQQAKVPVVILNGFLGSGKTTTLRNLLVQSKKKELSVSVVVNDMSELDVDGELIADTEIVRKADHNFESIHSCVLSSKKGIQKLEEVLKKMLSNHKPDLIIIETSGSCHPMPLIEFFKSQLEFDLTGVLVLADSSMFAQDYNYGEQLIPSLQNNLQSQKRDMVNLLVEQIMFCSHLILTKADRIPEGKLATIAQSIHPLNPYVDVLSVQFGRLDFDSILNLPSYDFFKVAKLIEELKPTLEKELDADRPYNMVTKVIKDDRPFHPQRLWEVCHKYLDQRIYRSKGFFWLCTRDKISLLWNQAAGNISLELMGYWRSGVLEEENNNLSDEELEQLEELLNKETGRFGDRHCHLTVIGDRDHVDRFTEALKMCFLTEEEIDHWEYGHEFQDPWPKNMVKMA
ncbi:GTPase, G3E family [Tenacibaculum sp. MAR_2009_124]|uniref:CobW family GTP-binding protein n=1 Tax=Tenacibaculum sp. MAR_2009_124 TaxID=1250059 RepID=UPI00089D89AB|nr:GTP-binding protein [Tenacibaculum sp. MAR_2009_124]SEB40116.1 GTPase, G3E family [Tenacibaculum sp. MAR_2009_124]